MLRRSRGGLFASIFMNSAPLDQESTEGIPISIVSCPSQSLIGTVAQGVETPLVFIGALAVPVIDAELLSLVATLFVVGRLSNLKLAAAPESNTV